MQLTYAGTKKIWGIRGRSAVTLQAEIQKGGRFVAFQYCISIVILSFRLKSDFFYIPPGQFAFLRGIPYTLLSFVAGWWGIPWGPIYTVSSIISNVRGEDVTHQVQEVFAVHGFNLDLPTAQSPLAKSTKTLGL